MFLQLPEQTSFFGRYFPPHASLSYPDSRDVNESEIMKLVSHILESKGHETWAVDPNDTVFDSLQLMADKEIGALLVMDGDKLVGIVTERDYARKVILEGKSSKNSSVAEVMTTRVLCVSPERTIDECMALMTEKRVRHLPVLDHKRVVGVLSIGDLVKAMISEQKILIDQLQHYIAGY
jgi:CBS domain-containing protein